jgi:multisubunit Na+/H+ antiporter MnhC subunit
MAVAPTLAPQVQTPTAKPVAASVTLVSGSVRLPGVSLVTWNKDSTAHEEYIRAWFAPVLALAPNSRIVIGQVIGMAASTNGTVEEATGVVVPFDILYTREDATLANTLIAKIEAQVEAKQWHAELGAVAVEGTLTAGKTTTPTSPVSPLPFWLLMVLMVVGIILVFFVLRVCCHYRQLQHDEQMKKMCNANIAFDVEGPDIDPDIL